MYNERTCVKQHAVHKKENKQFKQERSNIDDKVNSNM